MRLLFPRQGAPPVEPGTGRWDPEWFRWLQRMWTSMGWNPHSNMFDDIHPSLYAWTGATPLTLRNGQSDSMTGAFHIPGSYAQGTTLHPYLTVYGTSGAAAGADITFNWQVLSVGDTPGVGTDDAISPSIDDFVSVIEFTALSDTGVLRNDIVLFTLSRDDSDSYGGDVNLLTIGLKIAKRGNGQEVRF